MVWACAMILHSSVTSVFKIQSRGVLIILDVLKIHKGGKVVKLKKGKDGAERLPGGGAFPGRRREKIRIYERFSLDFARFENKLSEYKIVCFPSVFRHMFFICPCVRRRRCGVVEHERAPPRLQLTAERLWALSPPAKRGAEAAFCLQYRIASGENGLIARMKKQQTPSRHKRNANFRASLREFRRRLE